MSIELKSFLLLLFLANTAFAQFTYTHQDSLRGSITPERSWWDLDYYHLSMKVDPMDSTMHGNNLIQYKVLNANQIMQIDLQSPMEIKSVTQNGKELEFATDGFAHFVKFQIAVLLFICVEGCKFDKRIKALESHCIILKCTSFSDFGIFGQLRFLVSGGIVPSFVPLYFEVVVSSQHTG